MTLPLQARPAMMLDLAGRVVLILLLTLGAAGSEVKLRLQCQPPGADPGLGPAESWNWHGCLAGAQRGVWTLSATSGATLGGAAKCDPTASGAFTCESRLGVWTQPNVLIPAPAESEGPPSLVVFLPGTGASPANFHHLLQSAANAGHAVIGLSYLSHPFPTSSFVAWCNLQEQPENCDPGLHELLLFGSEAAATNASLASGGLWDVPDEASVVARLGAALSSADWGSQFLDEENGEVRWDRVIVSGHSQGAAHAAYLSQARGSRAVLFSGPQNDPVTAEAWLRNADDAIARRAMYHNAEECGPNPVVPPASYCKRGTLETNMDALGLTNIGHWDGRSPPARAQVVVMDVPPSPSCSSGRPEHSAVAEDGCAPVGTSNIEEVWTALFSSV